MTIYTTARRRCAPSVGVTARIKALDVINADNIIGKINIDTSSMTSYYLNQAKVVTRLTTLN